MAGIIRFFQIDAVRNIKHIHGDRLPVAGKLDEKRIWVSNLDGLLPGNV